MMNRKNSASQLRRLQCEPDRVSVSVEGGGGPTAREERRQNQVPVRSFSKKNPPNKTAEPEERRAPQLPSVQNGPLKEE